MFSMMHYDRGTDGLRGSMPRMRRHRHGIVALHAMNVVATRIAQRGNRTIQHDVLGCATNGHYKCPHSHENDC